MAGKTIALWGLAFKPNTDDMRETPSRVLMEALWDAGAKIQAHDPEAMAECERIYGKRDDLLFCDLPEEALTNADALILCTEWKIFRSPDFKMMRSKMSQPIVVDGRNIYDKKTMLANGFSYYSIGR